MHSLSRRSGSDARRETGTRARSIGTQKVSTSDSQIKRRHKRSLQQSSLVFIEFTLNCMRWCSAALLVATRLTRPSQQYYSRLFGSTSQLSCSSSSSSWKSLGNTKMTTNSIEDQPQPVLLPRWTVCRNCRGQGKLRKMSKKRARRQQEEANENNNKPADILEPTHPCKHCEGSGLTQLADTTKAATSSSTTTKTAPDVSVAIIGGGLAGLALATACRHRNISCRVYERDAHFLNRSQGYGLTLQQASKVLKAFGIESLENDGIVSTRHVVHTVDGTVVGEWGLRRWGRSDDKAPPKRHNIHIARQALRYHLLQAAGGEGAVDWNHKLIRFTEDESGVKMAFQIGDTVVEERADVLVGADGIRSNVREQWIGEDATPLRYLDCMVLLGICPLDQLEDSVFSSELLDGATVFQTADGETRIYMMPYSSTEYMWQLSFPMNESAALELSRQGPKALHQEALNRCQSWHAPIPSILATTPVSLISGYPVYDRALLSGDVLQSSPRITLIGDACHPMSPFKGQGANQALLDALQLAQCLYHTQNNDTSSLQEFETKMLERSAVKVQASANAARFLHSDIAIQQGNITRGAAAAAAAASGSVDTQDRSDH